MQEFLVFANIEKSLAENKRVIQERMALYQSLADARHKKMLEERKEAERIRKQLEEEKKRREEEKKKEEERALALRLEAQEAAQKLNKISGKNKLLLEEAKKLMTNG